MHTGGVKRRFCEEQSQMWGCCFEEQWCRSGERLRGTKRIRGTIAGRQRQERGQTRDCSPSVPTIRYGRSDIGVAPRGALSPPRMGSGASRDDRERPFTVPSPFSESTEMGSGGPRSHSEALRSLRLRSPVALLRGAARRRGKRGALAGSDNRAASASVT